MKIITLNTWSGRVYEPLITFFKNHADIDVFCLQEIHHESEGKEKMFMDDAFNLFNDIRIALPDHIGYFHPNLQDHWGTAMFVKKDIKHNLHNIYRIHHHNVLDEMNDDNYPRHMMHMVVEKNGESFSILNMHGINGAGKIDTADRIQQFSAVASLMKTIGDNCVLCGDFNLLMETESMNILSKTGFQNLIKDRNIQSTRTAFYKKDNKLADYIFVSPNIAVKDFKVLSEEVSDHAALYLEI